MKGLLTSGGQTSTMYSLGDYSTCSIEADEHYIWQPWRGVVWVEHAVHEELPELRPIQGPGYAGYVAYDPYQDPYQGYAPYYYGQNWPGRTAAARMR